MKTYRYETHCHTTAFSRCAKSSPEDMIKKYHELGYAGVIITEHFNGSCNLVRSEVTWKEYIDRLYSGYLRAKSEGEKLGVDVFFGFEYSAGDWAHILIYGLNYDWLINNPDLLDVPPEQVFNRARLDGGFLVHAHPFREGVDRVRLFPDLIDAVEVINACRTPLSNYRALKYAEMLDLPKTAGSDIHSVLQTRLGSLVTDHRLIDIHDYIQTIKDGTCHIDITE